MATLEEALGGNCVSRTPKSGKAQMAKIDFLLQAVTTEFHASALRKLLSRPDLKRFVASVAYVRLDGVNAVANELKTVAKVAKFFVGIRNDITSVQALRRLLELGVTVYAVDTASRSKIFHPKVFLAKGKAEASAIIGSANMTFSGLHNNIEAGAILALSLANTDDKAFLDSSLKIFDELPTRFPDHVFEVKNAAAVEKLFDDGRLVDEDIVVAPAVTSSVRKGERDKLTSMKLVHHASPERKRRAVKAKPAVAAVTPTPAAPAPTPAPAPVVQVPEFVLTWESRKLTERDLNIPSGKQTHATGSMLWKKGAAKDIDQRHFFRVEAFAGLDWHTDRTLPHYERADASFQIVVKGLNYGSFKLELSHNTKTNTKTYKQKNSMTSLHWGPALKFVAKRDLLARIMSLYRKEGNPPEFLIEID
jgi:HKD family nuclease